MMKLFPYVAIGALALSGMGTAFAQDGGYTIGVSNTVQGNGWREEMICSIRARASSAEAASPNTSMSISCSRTLLRILLSTRFVRPVPGSS